MKITSVEKKESTRVNEVEYDEFESDLGNVAVSLEHIERERRSSDSWDKIRENFSEDELLEKAHYRDIEDVEFVDGEVFPNIRVKLDGDWRRLFFTAEDEAEECFELLKYRISAYRQTHQ